MMVQIQRLTGLGNLKKYSIIIIPAIYIIWSLQMYLLGGPFSISRSDPEYPYLLNGLSCALFQFSNIGLTVHPGTPFEILTGIFIRITHLLIGQGTIENDVLLRPEVYLATASLYLSIITCLLIWWLGKVAVRTNGKVMGAVILQSSLFLSNVVIDMSLRYSADRILAIYVLVLAALTVKYLLTENYPVIKYAILSGVLMGIAFATKFNFLPVLAVPFFLIPSLRNKAIYSLTVAVSFIVGISPILNKFQEFRRFLSGLASHDGLYGQGSEKVINLKAMGTNFIELLWNNPAYTIILLISIGLVVYYLLNRVKIHSEKKYILGLTGFLVASLIGCAMVLKHFKIYYYVPVLSLTGLAFFMIWKISDTLIKAEKIRSITTSALFAILILVSVMLIPMRYRSRIAEKQANLKTVQFYNENVTRNDLLFIQPTWMGGPMIENALIYGLSYTAHREDFYTAFHKLYPNVIAWEGNDLKPSLFRTAEADPESIIYSGSDIYVYSTPGRHAGLMLNYLDTLAGKCGTRIAKDTVFSNPANHDIVIRVKNLDGWTTLWSQNELSNPTILSQANPVSLAVPVTGLVQGDYIEITVRISGNDNDAKCRLIVKSGQSDQDGNYYEDSGSLQNIDRGWQLLRLRSKINSTPADGKMVCQVYYPGNKVITVQDLQIKHMGRR